MLFVLSTFNLQALSVILFFSTFSSAFKENQNINLAGTAWGPFTNTD